MTKVTTTGERLVRLETQVTDMKGSLEEHKLEQRQDFDKLFMKIDSLENKFAGKYVEPMVKGILLTLISSVIGAIIYFI